MVDDLLECKIVPVQFRRGKPRHDIDTDRRWSCHAYKHSLTAYGMNHCGSTTAAGT
jgi:hypothetical protein